MGGNHGSVSRVFSGQIEAKLDLVLGAARAIGLAYDEFFAFSYPERRPPEVETLNKRLGARVYRSSDIASCAEESPARGKPPFHPPGRVHRLSKSTSRPPGECPGRRARRRDALAEPLLSGVTALPVAFGRVRRGRLDGSSQCA